MSDDNRSLQVYIQLVDQLQSQFRGEQKEIEKLWSEICDLRLLAMGATDLYISLQQKQHELGAGYLMVKSIGGTCCDFSGNDIGLRPYDFKTPMPVVMSVYPHLVTEFLKRCH